MKLLFDQNLSPGLVGLLAEVYPGSCHVQSAGLDCASDDAVWQYALEHGFALVTKDSDFQERAQVTGSKIKVIWIRRGNCSTGQVEVMLKKHASDITALENDPNAMFLILV